LWSSLRTLEEIHKLDEVHHADLAVVRPYELANILITGKLCEYRSDKEHPALIGHNWI
jgi:hypothetical protein